MKKIIKLNKIHLDTFIILLSFSIFMPNIKLMPILQFNFLLIVWLSNININVFIYLIISLILIGKLFTWKLWNCSIYINLIMIFAVGKFIFILSWWMLDKFRFLRILIENFYLTIFKASIMNILKHILNSQNKPYLLKINVSNINKKAS